MCILTQHAHLKQRFAELEAQNRKLTEDVAEWKTLFDSLKARPTLLPCGTIDLNLMSSILLDKMEEMGDKHAEIYLPDNNCKVYNKEQVKAYLKADERDSIVYVAEDQDCDDFATELFGKFAGLIWTNVHALNWFIDETNTLWFIEPQTDVLSQTLENWQGWDIRMFVGR